jgi:hypothetical protein
MLTKSDRSHSSTRTPTTCKASSVPIHLTQVLHARPGTYGYSNNNPNSDASSHGDSSLAVVVRSEDAWVLEGTVYLKHMSVTMATSQGTSETYHRPVSAVLLAV